VRLTGWRTKSDEVAAYRGRRAAYQIERAATTRPAFMSTRSLAAARPVIVQQWRGFDPSIRRLRAALLVVNSIRATPIRWPNTRWNV